MAFDVRAGESIPNNDMQLGVGVYTVTVRDYIVIAGQRKPAFVRENLREVLVFIILGMKFHAGFV